MIVTVSHQFGGKRQKKFRARTRTLSLTSRTKWRLLIREKNRIGILKSHYKGMSEAKKDTAVHNKHVYSSKKNHHDCLSAFTAYYFTCQE